MRGAATLALALVAGCVHAPPPDLSRDPVELMGQVRASQAKIRSVRGSARLAVVSQEQSGSLDAWLAAEKPARIRIEVLDFFGNAAAVLVAKDGSFALYDARAGIYYRGEATPENLARLLPLPIPVGDLAVLLCGSAPLLEGRAVNADPDGSKMRLEVEGPDGRQVLWVGTGATVSSALFEPRPRSRSPAWHVSFDGFGARDGALFPSQADLRSARARVTLQWKRDVEVNLASSAVPFVLEPPRGARIVDLSGGSPPSVELPFRGAETAEPER